ncbi:heterokaryon incompatibility protein-domain-containing protein [Pyrenochaeta sp. MPI-SDFR-AT-0127]|nr:heterokaryon incompatibility protein-domain-containing protein [Pyrenochaeta sp. MPI-SDFR-AT-0127]
MERFRYRPIDLDLPSFRLVRLLKGADEPIRRELIYAWLSGDDALEYEALSYTWRGTTKPRDIEIDGMVLPVTENLSVALQHLRRQDQDRILHQVQQMGDIYSQAEQVTVCLGPAAFATDILLESLRTLQTQHIKSGGGAWMPADPRWLTVWLAVEPVLIQKHLNPETLQRNGLQTLLKRPWFKRVWILEEVANAKRVIVYSGTQFISGSYFVLVSTLMGASIGHHVQSALDFMPGPSRNHSWWSQTRDLYTLLTNLKKSEATDPRDMVYALRVISISSDRSIHKLHADYTKSTNRVVSEVRSYLFKDTWTKKDAINFFNQRGNEVWIAAAQKA